MNRRSGSAPFFISFIIMALLICGITAAMSGNIPQWNGKPWLGIILGALAMVCAIPFHLFGRKRTMLYLISCLMNTVGAGLFVSSYFTYAGEKPSMADLLTSFAIVFAIMLLRCVFAVFDSTKKLVSRILLGINVAASVAVIVLWIMYGGTLCPMLFFLLVPEFMQGLFLLIYVSKPQSPLRLISFASYNYALVIGLAVLVILTEGEVLDGLFDGTELFSGRKKKLP